MATVGVDHHLHGALPATQLAGVGGDQERVRSRSPAFHAANIAAHAVCVLLVYAAARVVLTHAVPEASAALRNGAAVAAALLFGLHPLRVEVVAWISAMPYALALAFLLASLLAYLRTAATNAGAADRWRRSHCMPRRWPQGPSLSASRWCWSCSTSGCSSDARGRACPRRGHLPCWRSPPPASRAWRARQASTTHRGFTALQSAASAPFVYLWHTIAPVSLTPLDVLPADPVANPAVAAAALLALASACLAAWIWRHRWPALAAAWAAYLALLAPAAGLVPSGLQATADRYTYLPGVVVAIAVAVAGHDGRRRARAVSSPPPSSCWCCWRPAAVTARRVLMPWSDSVVVVDARRRPGSPDTMSGCTTSERRWPQPGGTRKRRHAIAKCSRCGPTMRTRRANLDRLDAARLEREGNELAATGRSRHGGRALPAGHRARSAAHAFAGGTGHGARDARPRRGSDAGLARSGTARHRRSRGAERTRRPAAPVGANARGSNGVRNSDGRAPRRCRPRPQPGASAGDGRCRRSAKTRRWRCGWRTRSSRPPAAAILEPWRRWRRHWRSTIGAAEAITINAKAAALAAAQGDRDLGRTDHCPGPSVSATRAVAVVA